MNITRAQLAIMGLPGCGKTTLANGLGTALDLPVLHTDDFKSLPWDKQSRAACEAVPERGIVEGVTVARMFRRGFHPDCVLYVMGGHGGKAHPSLLALTANGLLDYELNLRYPRRPGRVLHVPEMPSVDTVLWLMGTLGEDDDE